MRFNYEGKWEVKDVEGLIVAIDEKMTGAPEFENILKELEAKEIFSGKIGEHHSFSYIEGGTYKETVLIGLGNKNDFQDEKFASALASAYKYLKKRKCSKIGVDLTNIDAVNADARIVSRLVSEVFVMSDYAFDDYKSNNKAFTVDEIFIKGVQINEGALEEGIALGSANVFARKLTNSPANILTPTKLSEMALNYGADNGFEVEVKALDEIKALGMEAFLSVAKGSSEPPKLIIMRYTGNDKKDQRLGLVGKGLTYDSGGLSIKPTASMLNMKDDMAGASAVISAMGAIARMKLDVNVTAVVAACENMISGHSYKPGDIIGSMAGKTIFIGNTDAEGRLTLVDAVTYIQEHESVDKIVDIATLTGAAVQSLGSEASAVLSNEDTFYTLLDKAFDKAGEKQWRLPIFDGYKKLLKHPQADLTNAAGTPGAITAGLFIEAFIKDVPWVHIDIAGTAFKEKEDGYYSVGGTGAGVRPLYFLAKKLSK